MKTRVCQIRIAMATLPLLATLVLQAGNALADGPTDERQDWLDYYDSRYELDDSSAKRTDNRGLGDDELYGTRNFRQILKGVAYRGGANNRFHTNRRDNMNPLPDDGLQNLCEEGFGRSYYLYRTNFETAPELTTCESPRSEDQQLLYFQRSPNNSDHEREMLQAVFESIQDYRHGPIYLHCWNGWHASGLISAKILRQFCGLTAEQAVDYWDRNTDGHNEEPKYESIRRKIREFQPYPEFAISAEDQAAVCPDS